MNGLACGIPLQGDAGSVIRTNWGTTRRAEDPIGFRIEATFWWIVILAWTSGGVAHGLGLLVR